MKFLIRRVNPPADDNNQRSLPGAPAGYDISNGAITWISIIYILVNVLATFLGNYFTHKPQRELDAQSFRLKDRNFQVQLLQRVLEMDNDKDRKASLELLVKAGLLAPAENKELLQFINGAKYIPKWPKRDLELLASYLNASAATSVAPGAPASNSPAQIPPGLTDTSKFKPGTPGSKPR